MILIEELYDHLPLYSKLFEGLIYKNLSTSNFEIFSNILSVNKSSNKALLRKLYGLSINHVTNQLHDIDQWLNNNICSRDFLLSIKADNYKILVELFQNGARFNTYEELYFRSLEQSNESTLIIIGKSMQTYYGSPNRMKKDSKII